MSADIRLNNNIIFVHNKIWVFFLNKFVTCISFFFLKNGSYGWWYLYQHQIIQRWKSKRDRATFRLFHIDFDQRVCPVQTQSATDSCFQWMGERYQVLPKGNPPIVFSFLRAPDTYMIYDMHIHDPRYTSRKSER
jgi:hypothetical protein